MEFSLYTYGVLFIAMLSLATVSVIVIAVDKYLEEKEKEDK